MSVFRRIPGFASLARLLVLALGLGLAFEVAPVESAPSVGCAAADCMAAPIDEPREREGATVAIISIAIESVESVDKAQDAVADAAPRPISLILAPAFGEARELRHVRGLEVLPDKTGPPLK